MYKGETISDKRSQLSQAKQAILEKRLRGEFSVRKEEHRITPRRQTGETCPLSFAQQRLWFLDQFDPGSSIYNLPAALKLTGTLDIPALERTLNEVVRRHEILRTSFTAGEGQPLQVVHPPLPLSLPVEDLSTLPEEQRLATAQHLAGQEARLPFDLSAAPLLRARLLRLAEEDHVLLFTLHHIVSDGWSTGVLVKEVAALYQAFCRDESSPLAELPVQYADFALWQREWLQGEALETQLSYWRKQLGGTPPVLELPTDYKRPAEQSHAGGACELSLGRELTAQLKELGRGEGATLYMVLLAAFQTLLARYTGQQQITVGTPIANRTRAEVEGLIGFFVNTLVLRTDLAGDPSFTELLGRVREVTLGAYAHQDVPFEKLVEELQPERSLSHTPLFQAVLVLQNTPQEALELPGLRLEVFDDGGDQSAKFDLTLTLAEGEEGLSGSLQYNRDLFNGETIARMAGHFRTLLEAAAADPHRPVSGLPLLTEAEERQLLVEWNDTTADYPTHACAHDLFEQQAARIPHRLAVTDGITSLTYEQLNESANRLAHHLRALGVGPETTVAVLMERSPDMLVALLAVLKAGAAYLPLDPAYPAQRLAFMLGDARVSVLLTHRHLSDSLPSSVAHTLRLDADWPAIARQDVSEPSSGVGGDNLAYVIYTSGSTGRPKGVEVTHAALMNLVSWHQDAYRPGEDDRATLLAGVAFDASVWEVWPYLASGASIHIPDEATRATPEKLRDWLLANEITLSFVPTPLAESLVPLPWPARASLRALLTGGDRLHTYPPDALPFELVNHYGPTENTVVATCNVVVPEADPTRPPTIGRPVANTRAYILDEGLGVVPVGVAGQLYLSGRSLARGYGGRPGLTAERFIPHPFSTEPGARLYRTGDVARYLPGGEIEFLGRADHQVKVRGFRIELGEIEAALLGHESVREAAVVAREEAGGHKRLVAYVVAEGGAAGEGLNVGELRGYLGGKLPEYMVPSQFVTLAGLPLTPNGKVDRKALPAPERPELRDSYVAARTPAERVLADIWCKVLGLEQVGVRDNFFDLGGDSIRSIQLRAQAQKAGLDFSVQQLFRYQTIEELAQHLEVAGPDALLFRKTEPFALISEDERQLLPADVEDAYPITALQAGMFFHSEFSPDRATYYDISSNHLRGPLDIPSMEAAVGQLVARHPVLRTSFHLTGFAEPLQFVHRTAGDLLRFEDLSDLNADERERAINEWIEAEKMNRFDWTRPGLLRFHVHRRTAETFQFTVSFHHSILDGWSMATMCTELFRHYLSLVNGKVAFTEAEPESSFRDFVAAERATLESDEARRFWMEKLSDASWMRLPRWNPPGRTNAARGADNRHVGQLVVPVSDETSEGLKRLARRASVSIKSVLLAAHLRVMSLLSGQPDVVTGVVSNGRPEEADGERVLGLFLNTLPLRLRLSGGTWLDLARETFEVEKEAIPYRLYPMAALKQALGGQRLFETMFNFTHYRVYQGVSQFEELELLDKTSHGETSLTLTSQFNLDLQTEKVNLHLDYDPLQLCEEQTAAIAGYYARTLAAMASEPDALYNGQSLLSEDERRRVLVEWNDTAKPLTSPLCLHQLFRRQAERTPDAVALVRDDEQLTYRELDARANQLAHFLRRRGVGPESLVGVLMPRSVEMMVAVLATLKAGGAYLPLDPAYPAERLRYMVEDAGARVVLTRAGVEEKLAGVEGLEVVDVDARRAEFDDESAADLGVEVAGENLAYVIYTSGSTGRPKGIGLPQVALKNLIEWHYTPLARGARTLQFASLSFDASFHEMFAAWCSGGTLFLISETERLDVPRLINFMSSRSIEKVILPVVMLQQVAEQHDPAAHPLAGLKEVIATGEQLQITQPVIDFFKRLEGCSLHNHYGPSETHVVTSYTLDEDEDRWAAHPPIGRPIDNTEIYILDRDLNASPVGVPGELYIGGVSLARGYQNRPGLTAEKFVPDPFSKQPGARLYKTGDLSCYLPDGDIEYLGRIDHQVKIRGFRVELGEIEARLLQHEAVLETVVLVREDVPGDKRVIAYAVCEPGHEVGAGDLRNYLRERLPDYMIPSAFVMLERLPLTPNGKVDRRALPAPEQVELEGEQTRQGPRTPVEELLAGLFAQLLRRPNLGVHDSFFDLGGHSLLATQLVSRLRKTFKIELPLRALFEAPTVSRLAAVVEAELEAGAGREGAPPIEATGRGGELALSFAQRRLWFLDRLEPGGTAYNIPTAVRLSGKLNSDAFGRMLNEIVRRHEVLRTTFVAVDGQPVQVVHEARPVELPLVDLSSLPEGEREAVALRLATEEAQQPFDLETGPLVRVKLLRLDEDSHIMLVTMHHIISDGWSVGVLIQEVGALYSAFNESRTSPLSELPIQYADFAAWQQRYLSGESLARQLSYWEQQLGREAHTLELPLDHPRPSVQTHRGASVSFSLPESLSAQLKELGRGEGATLYMVLLAAFQTLLARYTGQHQITVGTPIANRTRAEVEGLIGFFVNTLVLRTDLSGDPTFAELLGRVREVTLGAYAHQDVPFEKLVEELQPERSLSHTPLFQAMLVLQNTPQEALELSGLRLEVFGGGGEESAKFDLTLTLAEGAEGLSGTLQYNRDLFEAATIERMAGHFRSLVEAAAAGPQRRLSALRMLTEGEERQLLVEWNDTARPYPSDLCLHQLFERQAARTPDNLALIYDDLQLTYAELDRAANRLAHFLIAAGVAPESLVGLCLDRSPSMAVALLAVLKAGGAYMPLDPSYPSDRLAFMLEDSGVRVLLTHSSLLPALPAGAARVICLDAEAERVAAAPADNPRAPVGPDNLAYVIYTSGSTGRPKGAMLEHRGVVNCLSSMQETCRLGAADRFLFRTSLNFDPSVWELLWPLWVGAAVVVAEPGRGADVDYFVELMAAQRVTTAYFVPTLLRAFVEAEGVERLTHLRRVICGGEALAGETQERFAERLTAELHNSYGPTETSIASTDWVCRAGEEVRIGRPLWNVRAYVLDGRGQPAPAGVAGELYIGGEGVGRGYLRRPGLTAERFVPDPFSAERGARLYRTGDVVRYRDGGEIEFLGRVDEQVKVRGYRIELGEIEAALAEHERVREAVVLAREEGGGEKRLVAYVVGARDGGQEGLGVGELRRHVAERLPEYMVPWAVVVLDSLPLMPNGKVDRRALPAPDRQARSEGEERTEARTPVEELVAGVWCGVLGLEEVGMTENFFELGGHSLLATRVVSRVSESVGAEISLRSLFERPTVKGLAEAVEEALRRGEGVSAPPLAAVSREEQLPLSFAQQRLWFLDKLEPGGVTYNLPRAIRFKGTLSVEALGWSFNEIVRRHEILRTSFPHTSGQPAQVVHEARPVELPLVDLSPLPEGEREGQARTLAAEEAQTPFDLKTGPLVRAKVLRLAEQDHVVLFTMHHIVSDGWSTDILVREVVALYQAHVNGLESPLPELPLQYADFAVWQRDWLRGEVLEKQMAYWRRQLGGTLPVLELPTDRPRPAVQSFAGATHSLLLSKELSEQASALSRREGVTLFMTLLAAFQTLLSRYTGQDDIVVGAPIAGRNRAQIEGLIGFFVNTLVLRTDLSGNPSFKELLGRVREVTLGGHTHQDVPFEKLVEELQPERSLSRTPLFQVAFVLQNASQESLSLPGLTLEGFDGSNQTAKFDLTMSVVETAEGLYVAVEYRTELFEEETIHLLLRHFRQLLAAAVADPGAPLSSLPLLAADERARILSFSHDALAHFPVPLCLHELFAQQAERTPDAVALVYEDGRLTYRELNERANRLAHHLLSLGVGAEDRVGLCLPRSLDLVTSLLAVLKAGGAYVPLDPAYPHERLAFMLEDSGVKVCVTDRELAGRLPVPEGVTLLCTEETADALRSYPATDPLTAAAPENLAYVIYTSGSTGRPKGALVTHANVARLMAATDRDFGFSADDVWTLFHSASFDFSVWEIWGALLYGGRLVVVPYLVSREPSAFYDLLAEERVTVLNQTPSAFRQLMQVDAERHAEGRGQELALRVVIFGGEALEVSSLRGWVARHGDASPQLVNMYGITETTVHVTYRRLLRQDVEGGSASVIGAPISDLRAYVLDERMELVPAGVAGEVYVGGAGVARGYLGRAGLTAERFVPDPFGGEAGGRLYRTGDVARRRRDGELEYVGRADEQVKVRGFRIELGEIEAALRTQEGVEDAVVVARAQGSEKRLVGYVVAKREAGVSVGELRQGLKGRLPEYMVPAALVLLDEMPLTAHGKVDRRRLPEPEAQRPEARGEYEGARDEVERRLVAVWEEVLGVEGVGIRDNFFDLGGDSIRSIQVMSKAKEQGLNFTLQQVFQHQTIGELAGVAGAVETDAQAAEHTEPYSLLSPEDRAKLPADVEDAYPLARLQAGMLFHSEFSPDSSMYHNFGGMHMRARYDSEAFKTAAAQLAARHPVLRTSFDMHSYSEPLQLVHREVEIPVIEHDIRHLSHDEQEQALAGWKESEKHRKFDCSRPPLVRFTIHQRSDSTLQFSWTEHHSILDGWSVASMCTELFLLYFSLLGEQVQTPEPPPRATYRDFVAQERKALASEECANYWLRKLGDGSFTKLRRWQDESGASQTADEAPFYHEVKISLELSDALKQTARLAGVPLKSLLLAVHMRVMSALVGGGHVQTGLVANGRSEEPGGERVLGLFLNSMPFRMKLKDGTWVELAREVFEAEKELMPFRRYPMAELQHRLGGYALFDTLFNFIHFHVYDNAKGVEGMEMLGGDSFQKTNYAMTTQFHLTRSSLDLNLWLECDRERLSEEQARAVGQYYLKTLELMAYEPESQCFARPLLTRDEMRKLLVEWTATEAEYPRDKCVHELFEAQVEQSPDAVAVVFGDERVTYAELNRRANQVAHYLRGLGVGPESLVGVCMQRSVEMIVSLLGILKAGGAYVPLDPTAPFERLAFMMGDARIEALLTLDEQSDKLGTLGVWALALDAQRHVIERQPTDNLPNAAAADNRAYIIYTSGSTGIPKGISITHRAVVRLVRDTDYVQIEPADRVAHASSATFDAATFELWGALLNGARVVPINKDVALSPVELAAEIREREISVLFLTTALFNQIALAAPQAFSTLRCLLFGGEAVEPRCVRKVQEEGRPRRLLHVYGPTESTTFATWHEVGDVPANAATVPIGRPIANTHVYVLDERMQPVGIGVPGELCIGGDGLARDYLNRPDLTAEKFIPHPFSERPGERLYLTGDVVRYAPDGAVEFIGRRDNQVKVRGFRIELGEIEAALGAHPLVTGCAVLAREDAPGDKRLVAYLTLEPGGEPPAADWRASLKERLPEYMVPSAFVVLEEFPLTPNGKVDRRALPQPAARPELESSLVAPSTPTEEMLAGIWAQVLRLERVGVHDDFFDLGGHSLSATQLISRVREAFKVTLPLRAVFENTTVALMAAAIEAEMRASRNVELPPVTRVSRDAGLPLSFAQQRLWFFQQFEPGSTFYNIPLALRLSGRLDVAAFERTLGEIVRRHEVLRTTFGGPDGRPVQIINEARPVNLQLHDLTHLAGDEREAEARRLASLEALAPFDLSVGPLLRASLLRLSGEDHILLFTMHHIISDGWSMGVLVREVAALYQAYSRGEESPLAELPIQYADYAAWQRGWLQGEVLGQQLSYWKRQVGGTLPVMELPTDRPRPAVQTFRGAQRSMSIDKELADRLRALCRREGVTLYMLLLAAFKTLLARYTEQDDILVGTVVANRTRAESEGLLGMFINMLTMRTDLSGNPSFTELLGRVREVALGAYAHQEVPFEKLVEELHPKRSLSHSPLVQVTFGLQNAPLGTLELPELRLDLVPFENESVRFDLTVWMSETEDGLGGSWTYSLDLFDEARIERMQRHYVTLLRDIVARPETKLKALEILTAEEREQQRLKKQASERKSHKKFLDIKPTAFRVSGKSPGDEPVRPEH